MQSILRAVRPLLGLFDQIYLTGGGVLDILAGRCVSDIDLEVYGSSLSDIVRLTSEMRLQTFVDRDRCVVKTKLNGYRMDLSVPRTGRVPDYEEVPSISPYEASARRDFTVNAMMIDLRSGEILDFWGGRDDLVASVLRPVDHSTFMEDPVRVFRTAGLLSRKFLRADPLLYTTAKEGRNTRVLVPAEAVLAELNKMLLGSRPSSGIYFLEKVGWSWPTLSSLKFLRENPVYHPEGNTFTHTMLALDEATRYRDLVPSSWQLAYMYGMLLHDVGKLTTMDNGSAQGHDDAGEPLARSFMTSLRASTDLIDKVSMIVKYHMRVNLLYAGRAKKGAYRRLQHRMPLEVLAYVARADSLGRLGVSSNQHPASERALSIEQESYSTEPLLKGRHLIQMGMRPGRHFREILDDALCMQADGMTLEDIKSSIARIYEACILETSEDGPHGD